MSRREDVKTFVTPFADGTWLCGFTGRATSDLPPNTHCCDPHADLFDHHFWPSRRHGLPFTRTEPTPAGLIGL